MKIGSEELSPTPPPSPAGNGTLFIFRLLEVVKLANPCKAAFCNGGVFLCFKEIDLPQTFIQEIEVLYHWLEKYSLQCGGVI